MKKLGIAALLFLASLSTAAAQCTGNAPSGRVCGNAGATSAPASWVVPDGVRNFPTYAAAVAATVGATTQTIVLDNYRAGAKGGGGKWTKQASANAVALANITTADGFFFHYTPEGDVEIQSLGAPYDGLSNAKTYFDAAIAFAAGARINVPAGIYRFDSALASTTNIVHLACAGHTQATSPTISVPAQASTLRMNFNGTYLFNIDNGGWNTFTGCMFESAAAQRPQTGGGAITATSSTGGVGVGLIIRDNAFSYLYDGVAMNKPSNPTIEGNVFNAHYRSALRYTTSGGLEGGIGTVFNNIFTAYVNTPANVIYSEIGYGKIHKNYMVGGNTGIDIFVQSGYSAGAVEITENQIEEQINYGVRLRSNGGVIAMAQVMGNQFSNVTNIGAGFVAHIAMSNFNGATVWADTTQIKNNILRSYLGATGRYIYVQSGTSANVSNNKIQHFGNAATVGIEVVGAELSAPIEVRDNLFAGNALTRYTLASLVLFSDPSITFAQLPAAVASGSTAYVTDAKPGQYPLTTGGPGAFAHRRSSVWLSTQSFKAVDSSSASVWSGDTFGARMNMTATRTYLEGTDVSGVASYAPFGVNGTNVTVGISGVDSFYFNASKGFGVNTTTDPGAGAVALAGTTSGSLVLKPAATAGTNTLTFPAGTTNFSATGGTGQVVKQTSAGGALTVATVGVGEVSGLGTGVATALGVNVGTAGSPVVNGGALGSPSSVGTLPAYTLGGTVSGGGNQINNVVIGTTTPLAGSFTTATASGLVTGNGLKSTALPTSTTPTVDGSTGSPLVHGTGAQNTTILSTNFYGVVIIGEFGRLGASAILHLANCGYGIVHQIGTAWVAATTTPAADTYSLNCVAGVWKIYSNAPAGAPSFVILSLRTS